MVHRDGGMTRSDLTRRTGLNRSTIADVVGDLAASGWIAEFDDAPRETAGRPSPRVAITDRYVALAANPELDAVTVGIVALGGRVLAQRRHEFARQPSAEEVVASISRIARELAVEVPGSRIIGAGVAVPGLVSESDGVVRLAPHLGWVESPMASMLSHALDLPVAAANDAHLGCRAEEAFGAGVGCSNIVYLNGGPSGIGGGLVLAGQHVRGSNGYAGELGHLPIRIDGALCACGAHGCLETEVSQALMIPLLGGGHPDDDLLTSALTTSRELSVAAEVDRQLSVLALALRGAVNLLNPEIVILGGYLAALYSAGTPEARARLLSETIPASAHGTRVVTAALGSRRLLIGAAELAFAPHFENPQVV